MDRTKRTRLAVVLLLAGALAACGPSKDLLIVTMDTTRADRLGPYGYERAATPTIDALAQEGVLYRRCYAPAPYTLPSHTSLMTGLYPPRHGVRRNPPAAVPEDVQTLAEVLGEHGYDTAAFVGAFVLDAKFGLSQGFGEYNDETNPKSEEERFLFAERNAQEVTDAALAWMAQPRERPSFLWVHYFDPHMPYEPPGYNRELAMRTPYDAEIAFVDTQLERLLAAVEERGRPTLVVLTADHGEGLGEHGELSHGLFAYNTTLHVPLIVRFPDRRKAGSWVPDPVSIVDVMPSVLRWLGVRVPDGLDGKPLPLEPETELRQIYFENRAISSTFGWAPLEGVIDGDWKLIEAPRPELYDLKADPHEEANLHGEDASNAERLSVVLEEFVQAFDSKPREAPAHASLTEESLDKLRALGYLAVAEATPPPEGGRDPKDVVNVFNDIQRARQLIQVKRVEEGEELLLQIVTVDDPTNFRALQLLAIAAADAEGLRTRLIEVLQEKLHSAAPPEIHASVMVGLGKALHAEQRYDEALDIFTQALEIHADDPRVLALIGDVHRDQGKIHEAVSAYERSLGGLTGEEGSTEWVNRVNKDLARLKKDL